MIRASLIVALLVTLVGCGGPPPPLPTATLDKASDSLRASLDAWKKGDSFESWKKRSPVAFTDQDWQAGAKLLEYEIKRVEGLSGENARGWVVRGDALGSVEDVAAQIAGELDRLSRWAGSGSLD